MTYTAEHLSPDDVCVIIPMFNEAAVISEVLLRVRSAYPHVICVDDGSTDGSHELAVASGARVVRHSKNLGAGAAYQTGIRYALTSTAARYFVTFDADGQHRIEDAIRMVDRAHRSRVDVVLASRFLSQESNIPPVRRAILLAGVLFTRSTTGLNVTDTHNGLRVLSRAAASRIRIRLCGMAHGSEILDQIARLNLTYEEVGVAVRYTEYSIAKGQRNMNALNILFDFFIHKLRAAE